jgi:hypothetical protein
MHLFTNCNGCKMRLPLQCSECSNMNSTKSLATLPLLYTICLSSSPRFCRGQSLCKRPRTTVPGTGVGPEAPVSFLIAHPADASGFRTQRMGFDPRCFFALAGQSPVSHPTCDVPFPLRRTGEYRKGMISARLLYQGVRRSVWDPETLKERIGDWGGPDGLGPLVCCRKANQ